MREFKKLSIIISLLNESLSIDLLIDRIMNVMTKHSISFELILIDDGSSDNTYDIIKSHHLNNPNINGIRLSKNFGQQIALMSGIHNCSGDIAVLMDGDLQHSPETIIKMIQKWQEGYDVVHGVRSKRIGENFLKILFAWGFYKLYSIVSSNKIYANSGIFQLIDKKVICNCIQIKEPSPFLNSLISSLGYKETFIEFESIKRVAGKTKYTFKKSFYLMLSAMTFSFETFYSFVLILVIMLSIIFFITNFIFLKNIFNLFSINLSIAIMIFFLVVEVFMGTVFFIMLYMTYLLHKIAKLAGNYPLYLIKESTLTIK